LNKRKFSLILTIVVVIISIHSIYPQILHADGDEISVIKDEVENDFPNGIKFHIEASSPAVINDVRVYFRKLGQKGDSGYRLVEFGEGKEISGYSEIISGKNNEYIGPGTRLEYYYDIRDSSGRNLRTDEKIFTYLDNRFEWSTVTDGLITVFYFGEGSKAKAEKILDLCKYTLEQMGPILGIKPNLPLHIVTYEDYSDMKVALPFRSQSVSDGLITQGIAFADERSLVIYTGGTSFIGTAIHEFTHLLVGDAAGRAYNRVPLWLNEGLAEYANIHGTYESYLQEAIRTGELLPLWQRETFSGTNRDILIGYGQGESVVTFLLNNHGTSPMPTVFEQIQSTFDIDLALETAYGFNQHGLDSLWRENMGLNPLPDPNSPTQTPSESTTEPMGTPDIETLTALKTPEPRVTPLAQSQPTNTTKLDKPGGCNPSSSERNDFSTVSLMSAPFLMMALRGFRKKGNTTPEPDCHNNKNLIES
jgi:hypothetical protein